MTSETFRKLALAFPDAVEGTHMGHPDFRVNNRIFASLTSDEARGSIKCDAATIDMLVRSSPEIYRDAWGGRWLGVALDGADEGAVTDLLEDAWKKVAPKRVVAAWKPRA